MPGGSGARKPVDHEALVRTLVVRLVVAHIALGRDIEAADLTEVVQNVIVGAQNLIVGVRGGFGHNHSHTPGHTCRQEINIQCFAHNFSVFC